MLLDTDIFTILKKSEFFKKIKKKIEMVDILTKEVRLQHCPK